MPATLAGVLLLASMALLLQSRGAATARVLAGIERHHREALDEAGALEVVRALLASSAPGDIARSDLPRLDGSPFVLPLNGTSWEVRATDVEGLIDLYLSPPEVLALLPAEAAGIDARRAALLEGLPPGTRFPSEAQTLARLGFDAAARARLAPLVTQMARTGEINPDLAPASIRAAAATLAGADRAAGQTAEIDLRKRAINPVTAAAPR